MRRNAEMKYAVFVRHGESESNIRAVLSSRTGSYHLTEKGIGQVEKTAQQLDGLDIRRVYCSPVERARETCGIIAKRFKLEPEIREEIRETDFGKSEGIYFPGKISELTDEEREEMGIESWSSHVKRVGGFFSSLRENSLIVSHGFLIKAFVSDALGLGSDESYGINIRFASITIMSIPDAKVLCLGAVALSHEVKSRLGARGI